MQQAWNEKDECEWEKIRFECYITALSNGAKIKDITQIMNLPTIDGDPVDLGEKLREKLLAKQKEFALLM